jgi:hypothetical protein
VCARLEKYFDLLFLSAYIVNSKNGCKYLRTVGIGHYLLPQFTIFIVGGGVTSAARDNHSDDFFYAYPALQCSIGVFYRRYER